MIYFDNAATTFPKPQEVYNGINYAMQQYSFNAGRGSYSAAKKTFKMIEETRNKIGALIDVSGNHVVFTSSATESLNNIIYGLNLKANDIVFVSPFEHNAVIRTLFRLGINIVVIPFDREKWTIDKDELISLYILKKPKATIISHISNVTGFELPYKDIFEISKDNQSINVLDCAQSYGIYQVDKKNVDFIVFAGHKSLYAMFGIAGYINITKINLIPFKVGGTGSDSLNPNMPIDLPSRYEAGSLNSVGIYSINVSIDYLKKQKFDEIENELTSYLISKLHTINNIVVYLPDNYISHGIVSFNIEGFSSDDVGMILNDDYDICVRTGYHCAPYIHDFLGTKSYNGTVRVSLGIFNTKKEIDTLIEAIKEISN